MTPPIDLDNQPNGGREKVDHVAPRRRHLPAKVEAEPATSERVPEHPPREIDGARRLARFAQGLGALAVAVQLLACGASSIPPEDVNRSAARKARAAKVNRDPSSRASRFERVYRWNGPPSRACPPSAIASESGSLANGASVPLNWPAEVPGSAAKAPRPRPGATSARTGSPRSKSTSGAIANAARIVGSMRPGFRACFQRFLDRRHVEPGWKLGVRVAIYVGCDGSITGIRTSTRLLDAEAITCMFRTIRPNRFNPPEAGSSVINVPVTFVRVPRAK
jgi:hypothetical protein